MNLTHAQLREAGRLLAQMWWDVMDSWKSAHWTEWVS